MVTRSYLKGDTFSSTRPVTIGIVGGGQLGKMIAQEAKRMSLTVKILDPTEGSPASSVSDEQIVADFKDEAAIKRLAEKCDVLTYEIELANSSALKELESKNYPVHPSPRILRMIQNKYIQKSVLMENGIPVADFSLIRSEHELEERGNEFGYPLMLKSCEDAYDGRGNFLIKSRDELKVAFGIFSDRQRMVEKFVKFSKEISVMVARNSSGQIVSFPVAENIHKNSILDTTLVPARISPEISRNARRLAEKTLRVFQGAGIFGIEMFIKRDGEILVNEIAPRPHNSGHYANEACTISQFEQHLRAILDLPLVEPELLRPAVMVNILGPEDFEGPYYVEGIRRLLAVPGIKLYLYGKMNSKPRRKLGHITATGRTLEQAIKRANKGRKLIHVALDGVFSK